MLLEAPWPGNVRELRNVVKRAVLLAKNDVITPAAIVIDDRDRLGVPVAGAYPDKSFPSMKNRINAMREEIEKKELINALRLAGGNKAKAARMLKIDRVTLYAKIRKYSLPSSFASAYFP